MIMKVGQTLLNNFFFIYYEKQSINVGQGCGIKSNKYDEKPSKLYAPIQIIQSDSFKSLTQKYQQNSSGLGPLI